MNIFQENIQKYEAQITKLNKVINQLSAFRVITFIAATALIIILIEEGLYYWLGLALPLSLIAFALLVNRYKKINWQKKQANFLKTVNESEILKANLQINDFPDGGQHLYREHPYIADLDIFGKHSLFQLINRGTTESGQILLAQWLAEPTTKDTILERQAAIQELTPQLDWRQDFQASGLHFENKKSDYNKLMAWIKTPEKLLPQQTRYLLTAILLGVLSTVALVYVLSQVYSPNPIQALIPLLVMLVINNWVLRRVKPSADDIVENTFNNVKVLGAYQSLINKIEKHNFEAPRLQTLRAVFHKDNFSASQEINKLKNILEFFQQKGNKKAALGKNSFYTFMNLLWLLDIPLIILTEKWKAKNKALLKYWGDAVSEFEVFNSLAGFAYANPDFTFPEIQEDPYIIHFEALGHPLLNPKKRICNDFTLKGRGEIAMITGSNMAGKSTFLRTLGMNLTLALMGAPCFAKAGQVSNMKLFTSMRTQDNLEEGVSSFYAELQRIEQLLKLIQSGEAIFFLVDEMFKGTNSKDRYRGGVSLIKQLSELNSFGIISTHDLELAQLAGNHLNVKNFSFNSEINDGNMRFNYKLTPGICKDFNASELMKRSGIKILSNIEEAL